MLIEINNDVILEKIEENDQLIYDLLTSGKIIENIENVLIFYLSPKDLSLKIIPEGCNFEDDWVKTIPIDDLIDTLANEKLEIQDYPECLETMDLFINGFTKLIKELKKRKKDIKDIHKRK